MPDIVVPVGMLGVDQGHISVIFTQVMTRSRVRPIATKDIDLDAAILS